MAAAVLRLWSAAACAFGRDATSTAPAHTGPSRMTPSRVRTSLAAALCLHRERTRLRSISHLREHCGGVER